ncbi:hypothetical protein OUZ56_014550 [Daphnia magna]|uniref:Uncharacterized protein n=1 Tax=Daphnia magna TaxID=35525 RepID=A0ABR0AKH9_9CRUS|nr:hypothetical protein OUZ56_014550 [Daphnia magna]
MEKFTLGGAAKQKSRGDGEGVHRGTSCCELVNPLAATPDRALFYLMVYAMGGTVAAPLGAVGNAPVGTSLCRCGGRFLGCAFPEWNLLPCQPGLVFGQVPPCSWIHLTRSVATVVRQPMGCMAWQPTG